VKRLILLLLLVLAAGLLLFLPQAEEGRSSRTEGTPAKNGAEPAAPEPLENGAETGAGEAGRKDFASVPADEAARAATKEAWRGKFTVLLRVVDEQGNPVAGAEASAVNHFLYLGRDLSVDPPSWDLPRLDKEVQRARALRINRVEDRAVADPDGNLALQVRTGADFWIAVEAPGRARTARWMKRMDADSRIDLGEVVLHPGRQARIRVRDPRGLPVEGAVVRVISDPPSKPLANPPLRVQEGVTDPAGLCEMDHLAGSPARVLVRVQGFLPAEAPLPDSGLLTFDLKTGGRITVQVHAAPGSSPEGVPVICLPVVAGHPLDLREESFGNASRTDMEGKIVFEGLGAETPWRIAALANDYEILVAETAEVGARVDLELPGLFLVRGRLLIRGKPPGPETFFKMVKQAEKQGKAILSTAGNDALRTVQADGRFQVRVPPGRYLFGASAPGFEALPPEEIVVSGPTDLGDLEMTPTVPVTLEFVDAETGKPVPVVFVAFWNGLGNQDFDPPPAPEMKRFLFFVQDWRWPASGDDGRIVFDRLGAGVFLLGFRAPGYSGIRPFPLDLRGGEPFFHQVKLFRPTSVDVVFQLPEGRTLEGLQAWIRPVTNEDGKRSWGSQAEVDPRNRVSFSTDTFLGPFHSGTYELGLADFPLARVEVQAGRENRVAADLRPQAWAEVRVFEGGRIVPGASVRLAVPGTFHGTDEEDNRTAPDGRILLPPVPPGSYRVFASHDHLKSPAKTVTLAPGVQVLDVALQGTSIALEVEERWKDVRIGLRLLYPDTPVRPLFGPLSGNPGRSQGPGRWVIEKVSAGTYQVTVTAAGAAYWRSEPFPVQDRPVDLGKIPLEAGGKAEIRLAGWSQVAERLPRLELVAVVTKQHFFPRSGGLPDRDPALLRFAHLPPGEYQAHALWVRDGARQEKTSPAFEVEAGKTAEVELDFSE